MESSYVCGGPVIPTRFGGKDPRDLATFEAVTRDELTHAKSDYDEWLDKWSDISITDDPEAWYGLYLSAGLNGVKDGEVFLGLALAAALVRLSKLEDREALAERNRVHAEEHKRWLRDRGIEV
jgi:hypothetical protein